MRQLQIAVGLWIPRKLRPPKIQQRRMRRACVGELIQIDGCEHRWFEDRGSACTALVFIDDATRYAGKYLDVYQFPDGKIEIRPAGEKAPPTPLTTSWARSIKVLLSKTSGWVMR